MVIVVVNRGNDSRVKVSGGNGVSNPVTNTQHTLINNTNRSKKKNNNEYRSRKQLKAIFFKVTKKKYKET